MQFSCLNKITKNDRSWSFQAFLNTQREILPSIKNVIIPPSPNYVHGTVLVHNSFYDLQVVFIDMCFHGYPGFVDMLCGSVTCVHRFYVWFNVLLLMSLKNKLIFFA